jgi:hypothetical protein
VGEILPRPGILTWRLLGRLALASSSSGVLRRTLALCSSLASRWEWVRHAGCDSTSPSSVLGWGQGAAGDFAGAAGISSTESR